MKEAKNPVEIISECESRSYYIKLKHTKGAGSIVKTDKKAISEFSPDGKLLARAKYNEISIYDNSTDQCLFILHGHPDCIDQLFFSPDVKLIHSVSEQEKRTWDLQTGECLSVLQF
jgi:WD40 repeat protein